MRSVRLCSASAGLVLLSATAAAAQVTPGSLSPGAGSLIIDQQRTDRQLPTPPPTRAPTALAPAVTIDEAAPAPATPLREIRLVGSSRLAPRLPELTARFSARPLNAAGVKAAADAVSALYAEEGLAFYTVSAPRQDLGGGVLVLQVIEGYIGEVTVSGAPETAESALVRAYVRRLREERPLTRRTLERYLSLIRDIPGLTVDAQLYATSTPGAVRLALTLKQKRLQPELAFNNRGTPRLGSVQVQGSVAAYHVLRAGDQLKATLALPTDLERFQYLGLSYATPVGHDGLTLLGAVSYLRTRPEAPPIAGEAVSAAIQASFPILRGYSQNLYVNAALDGLNNDNTIYGLSITSDHTRAGRLSLAYSDVKPKRSLAVNATVSAGLDLLAARADSRLTDQDFRKLTVQAAGAQGIGQDVAIRLRALAQLSRGRLPTAEQLPLGGEAFGRAFPSAVLIGDHGYAGSAELGWMSRSLWPAKLKGSELYGFVDGGRIFVRERLPYAAGQRRDLASAGVGARLNWRGKLMAGLEFAKAVDAPAPSLGKPWRVLVSWRTLR